MRRQVIGDLIEAGRLPRRLGGLRGGHATVSPSGMITLTKAVYVPGVEVSGTVPLDAGSAQRLRVGGDEGAHGNLTVTPLRITGRLGGRLVNLVARSAGVRSFQDAAAYRPLLRRFRLLHAG
jgi:hypothetical protein